MREARRAAGWRVALGGLVIAAAILAAPAMAQQTTVSPAAGAAGFSAAQRAEIVEVMRTAMRADPTILRDAITALQAEESGAQAAAARVAIGRAGAALAQAPGDPTAGNPQGDVTVVEFYDLRCPYCRKMLPVMAALVAHDPRLRLVFKDIPILGEASVLGARAMLAAQRQDGYLRLQSAIMSGSGQITETSLREAAIAAGLDWQRLRHDMDAPEVLERINANLRLAQSLGIDGTPTFVIGAKLVAGAAPLDELRQDIAAARARHG